MRKILAAAVLLAALALPAATAQADGTKAFACPDLSTAEQLGSCPSEEEIMRNYRVDCPPHLERAGDCMPFQLFAMRKNKAIWAVMSGGEEFLPYVSCGIPVDTVKGSKAVSLRVSCRASGRCQMLCGYENDITLRLRFKGKCTTATEGKIDCKENPMACVAQCAVDS